MDTCAHRGRGKLTSRQSGNGSYGKEESQEEERKID